jgi:periplasmic divalent cation tolerance protein
MSDAVIVLTTWPAEGAAAELAQTLVTERLAACVNVLGEMQSTYRWQGSVEVDRERQLVIKTTRAKLAALEARLGALHPYQLPEFLVLSVEAGSVGYLDWLRESTA